jgi:bifunctional UDP-N-acetylglucosamine pyrophosphorylase/glucosamine-1-phosphate N-acetyltransferase
VETLRVGSAEELRGVNSRAELAELGTALRTRKNRSLMAEGVTLEDPATTYVDEDVAVGADTVLGPAVRLEGRTTIGSRCRIQAGVRLTNAKLADEVTVLDHSVIVESIVERGATVGPFAHVRPESVIAERARVGNFVELKKTRLGRRSKASHLTYLGDAVVGDDVNIGAGTITCNYDGERKHQTTIEDGVFVGSDSQLVAPVTIGRGAYVAAGSSVVEDVPADALAIARAPQQNKPGWVARRRARRAAEQGCRCAGSSVIWARSRCCPYSSRV